ncbi:MAG: response regulator [Lachnospirales bacterium]
MFKVVIADDEPFVIEGLKSAIDWEGSNFEIVYTNTNPLCVLEYIGNNPVDLLITDIQMPEMTGLDLILKTKVINEDIFVLVLSAYDNFEYVRTALRNGAENYLLKPLDPSELQESITSIEKHIRTRSNLQINAYGSSISNFRSIFVENWVKNILSTDEFLTRAQMLGINLQLNNYTVLLFTTNQRDTSSMASLFDKVISIFIGKFQSHFYFETSTCLVSIISKTGSRPDVRNLLAYVDGIREEFVFPFFVSIGNTVDNYEEVGDSYRHAKKYQFLRYTSMTGIVCTADLLPLATRKIIEQDFDEVNKEDYVNEVVKLFAFESTRKERMDMQLAILSHGINQVNNSEIDEEIEEVLKDICCNSGDLHTLKEYVSRFINTCFNTLATKQEAQNSVYPYVDVVIEAIQDISNKDISLKTLAAQLDMHPSYLGNIFHKQTGYYFNDYLNEERLKYAAKLMENTSLKLKEIVEKTGFSSQTYFNRLFKRRFGVPPLAYRREMKLSKGKG